MERPKRIRVGRLTRTLPNESAEAYIPSDVLGSYTGLAMDGDRPIQDADDL